MTYSLIAIKIPPPIQPDVPDLIHHRTLSHRSYRNQMRSRLFSTHSGRMTWKLRPYGVFARDNPEILVRKHAWEKLND